MSTMDGITDYHAQYYAYELTKRCAPGSAEKLAGAVARAGKPVLTKIAALSGIIKPVRWVGSSRKDFGHSPRPVRKQIGGALFAAQNGEMTRMQSP